MIIINKLFNMKIPLILIGKCTDLLINNTINNLCNCHVFVIHIRLILKYKY